MMDIYVSGIGMTRFGKLPDRTLKDLLVEAASKALEDAGNPRVDAIFVGNYMGGIAYKQEILGALVANELGLGDVPSAKVEGACASGGIAFRQAYLGILSGEYETVLAVGGEKMKQIPTAEITSLLNTGMDNQSNEKYAGLTFPGFFGVVANRYMHETGATKEHLAMIALKNRENAVNNPLAQFREPADLDEIMNAKMITEPLGLFDCSPTTDGAAAVVLTKHETDIRILASAQASGPTQMQNIEDLLTLNAVKRSGELAFEKAGLGPEDIDVVEIHDCFSITEIVASESLGFFERGKGFEAVAEGRTKPDGDVPINTSGGLLSRGHPIGATGIAQIYQIVQQLRGIAPNQVEGARIGLAQNLGGTGAYSTVHILERLG